MELRRAFPKIKIAIFGLVGYAFFLGCTSGNPSENWAVSGDENKIMVQAGMLERSFRLTNSSVFTEMLTVNGHPVIAENPNEFSVTFWKASSDAEPQGIGYSDKAGVEQEDAVKNQTDALNVAKTDNVNGQTVEWIDPVLVTGKQAGAIFDSVSYSILFSEKEMKRLVVSLASTGKTGWKGISAEINYEIYEGFPVIRKWIKFSNQGQHWIKIDRLTIEDVEINEVHSSQVPLSPGSAKFAPAIVAFSDSAATTGIILASEAPSKLRALSVKGASGYHPDFFEWALGPGESFVSEPVLVYAFSGENYPTASSVSTALDRCVESEFQLFLNKHILRPVGDNKSIAPVFCTWTNYAAEINDSNMRVATDIAAQIGFKCFQLDAGWSDAGPGGGWAVSTTNPVPEKFPDLKGLSSYIQSKNMKTGLWYSVFINEQQADKSGNEPPLFSLPLIRRAGGLGLSLCYEKSRKKYAGEIVSLHKMYQAEYFKQDLSNVCYGDIAHGHESRTLKESYLRGLRGLLATQDEIHRQAPDVWLQLSHEIYWETPGPEADIAVLKHADSYHSAPNEYWGAGNRKQLVGETWKYNVDSLQQKLKQGAFRARDLMYRHRGLPLDRIEVFGAVTTNFNGSLTPEIQDRQICSWLMGAPLSFSGDLTSLTNENIEHYRGRFALLENLQQKYSVYSRFQFSGVPAPTDEGWHWWGKLNENGCGAVVVLRGSAGADSQKVNIPWVKAGRKYKLTALLSGKQLGNFTGEKLQNGELEFSLPRWGQEIIEIAIK
ncbi:MAG: alpha-galactosidase [Prolixibacteraceae bacterium]|jgi:hypothetical protein|nr:alpha-galactosidase [Prolixibacteraceae bacterium]